MTIRSRLARNGGRDLVGGRSRIWRGSCRTRAPDRDADRRGDVRSGAFRQHAGQHADGRHLRHAVCARPARATGGHRPPRGRGSARSFARFPRIHDPRPPGNPLHAARRFRRQGTRTHGGGLCVCAAARLRSEDPLAGAVPVRRQDRGPRRARQACGGCGNGDRLRRACVRPGRDRPADAAYPAQQAGPDISIPADVDADGRYRARSRGSGRRCLRSTAGRNRRVRRLRVHAGPARHVRAQPSLSHAALGGPAGAAVAPCAGRAAAARKGTAGPRSRGILQHAGILRGTAGFAKGPTRSHLPGRAGTGHPGRQAAAGSGARRRAPRPRRTAHRVAVVLQHARSGPGRQFARENRVAPGDTDGDRRQGMDTRVRRRILVRAAAGCSPRRRGPRPGLCQSQQFRRGGRQRAAGALWLPQGRRRLPAEPRRHRARRHRAYRHVVERAQERRIHEADARPHRQFASVSRPSRPRSASSG